MGLRHEGGTRLVPGNTSHLSDDEAVAKMGHLADVRHAAHGWYAADGTGLGGGLEGGQGKGLGCDGCVGRVGLLGFVELFEEAFDDAFGCVMTDGGAGSEGPEGGVDRYVGDGVCRFVFVVFF
jgi:hypothetical protein